MYNSTTSKKLNPNIEKYLSTPLSFTPGRQQQKNELTDLSTLPDSYIVLSKNNNSSNMVTKQKQVKNEVNKPQRPTSLAEAISSYTGNKYSGAKERKRKRKLQLESIENEENQQEEEESSESVEPPVKKRNVFNYVKSFFNSTSNNDKQDEDLGEDIESSSSAGEAIDENSPFTGFSEAEKSDTNKDDQDEDEVDEDYNSEQEESNDEESNNSQISSSDEDEDLEKLKHDLKRDQMVEEQNEDEDDSEETEKFKQSSTPPTSPDEEISKTQVYELNENQTDQGSNGSKRIYKNWKQLQNHKPPIGLLNTGVTCYMNSAIQSLIHIPALQHYLNDINHNEIPNLKPRSISHVLAELSKRMWNSDKKFIIPKKIIHRLDEINCMMSAWNQEDSHEYFMSLISRLQEDSTPKGAKLNTSIIYDIFGGLLNQKIKCHKCNHTSTTNQEMYDLSLSINKKKMLDNLIRQYFQKEQIGKVVSDSKSGYYCDHCKQLTNASKQYTILTAPETLTIHLKRFKFNGNSSSKVKTRIEYPNYLDLSSYMEKNIKNGNITETVRYKLISVIVHEGRSISSGHYVAYCLQPDGKTWCSYDDEYINTIDEKRVLNDPSAYVLVYTRLTSKK